MNGQGGEHTKNKMFEVVASSSSNGRQQNSETSPEMVSSGWQKEKRKVAEKLKRYTTDTDDIKIVNINWKEFG